MNSAAKRRLILLLPLVVLFALFMQKLSGVKLEDDDSRLKSGKVKLFNQQVLVQAAPTSFHSVALPEQVTVRAFVSRWPSLKQDTEMGLNPINQPRQLSQKQIGYAEKWLEEYKLQSGKQRLLQAMLVDYFKDWPSPSQKGGCPDTEEYKIKDKHISVVLYMADDLESLPVQTFLSVLQFSRESGYNINRVVLAHTNANEVSTVSHVAHIEYIKNIAGKLVMMDSVSAQTEWQAKKKGLEMLKTDQVLMIDDTVVVRRNYLSPLLSELKNRPKSLIYPHRDSLVPWGIYSSRKYISCYIERMVREENSLSLYNITSDWQLSRIKMGQVLEDSTPVSHVSAGLTGQVLVAQRQHLLYLLSLMKTDDVVELSILSWLCGDGVVTNKCSAVTRVNFMAAHLSVPVTRNQKVLEATYSLSDKEKATSNQRSAIPSTSTLCKMST